MFLSHRLGITLEKLSEIDRSVPIHIRNLKILAKEFFKESKDLAPIIFSDMFSKQSVRYNLREFSVSNVKITFHGTESLSYLGPKIWDLVWKELKDLSTLNAFKREIKKWKPENCPCRQCKKKIQNLGFIWYFFWNSLIFLIFVLALKNLVLFCVYQDILLNCFCL